MGSWEKNYRVVKNEKQKDAYNDCVLNNLLILDFPNLL
jgi:hypothetical protein